MWTIVSRPEAAGFSVHQRAARRTRPSRSSHQCVAQARQGPFLIITGAVFLLIAAPRLRPLAPKRAIRASIAGGCRSVIKYRTHSSPHARYTGLINDLLMSIAELPIGAGLLSVIDDSANQACFPRQITPARRFAGTCNLPEVRLDDGSHVHRCNYPRIILHLNCV